MPVRLAVTEGTSAGCSQALTLIEGIEAECLLADKAYDTNEIIAAATELGMEPVIPPKSNRKEKRDYDRALYRLRHLVENGFLDFKQWRGVATRYAKRTASYLAACQLRAVMIWSGNPSVFGKGLCYRIQNASVEIRRLEVWTGLKRLIPALRSATASNARWPTVEISRVVATPGVRTEQVSPTKLGRRGGTCFQADRARTCRQRETESARA